MCADFGSNVGPNPLVLGKKQTCPHRRYSLNFRVWAQIVIYEPHRWIHTAHKGADRGLTQGQLKGQAPHGPLECLKCFIANVVDRTRHAEECCQDFTMEKKSHRRYVCIQAQTEQQGR